MNLRQASITDNSYSHAEPEISVDIPREPDMEPLPLSTEPTLKDRSSVNVSETGIQEPVTSSSTSTTPVKRQNFRTLKERKAPEKFKDFVMK